MKRKLLSVAVAGAFAAPALAMAAASTVQIYGKITAEYGYVDQGTNKKSTDILQTPGGTNVGVKGQEKLGGGLSAWFQCESSADVRGEGQSGFCTRNSAIGFKGGFGNVYIGKWDTPFKKAMSVGDGVGSEDTGLQGTAFLMAGSSTGTSTVTSAGVSRHIWKRRQQTSINYETPHMNGFSGLFAYTTGNAATAASSTTVGAKPRVISVAGIYKNGPVRAAIGYEKHNEFAVSGTQALDDHAWVIAGAYKFANKVTVGGAYNKQNYDEGAGQSLDKKAWTLGVDWDLSGPHSVGGSYTKADTSGSAGAVAINGTTVPFNVAGATGAKLWQIYYGHAFSKRTTAKLTYVRLDNDANAKYTLGGVKGSGSGFNQDAFVLLLKHTF